MSVYSRMAYGVLPFSRLSIDAQHEPISRMPSLISCEMPIFLIDIIYTLSRSLFLSADDNCNDRNYHRPDRPISFDNSVQSCQINYNFNLPCS